MKKTLLFGMLISCFAIASAVFSTPVHAQEGTSIPRCVRSGCSGQLCVPEGSELNTTCEFRPEYACYQQAACERNNAGNCAFTITPQVQACLDGNRPSASPVASPQASPVATPEASPEVSPSPTVIQGDLNGDGKVNLVDYSIMINELFDTGPNLTADINKDGKVNLVDYSILISNLST